MPTWITGLAHMVKPGVTRVLSKTIRKLSGWIYTLVKLFLDDCVCLEKWKRKRTKRLWEAFQY
jgi:hypothetical protein